MGALWLRTTLMPRSNSLDNLRHVFESIRNFWGTMGGFQGPGMGCTCLCRQVSKSHAVLGIQ